ncbi:FAD-dependent oxidoreductase [Brevundimonas sp. LM2]|nr:FAD-dependent oxidoreductase [Brevundimonas sp. LM2]
MSRFDLAVVGAGILGLAHALAAAKAGKSVVVIDRDAQAVGASIRNFGFVTITGQRRGDTWRRARRSRDVWVDVAAQAGIPIEQRGLIMLARRPESRAVLEAFMQTEMAADCALYSAAEARRLWPALSAAPLTGALWSPHEVRVESRTAVPRLAAWLAEAWGVRFVRSAAVQAIAVPRIQTSRGVILADACVVCPGDDLISLYPETIAARGVTLCKLQMLRLADPGIALPAPLMSDLGLTRYRGYADLPKASALGACLSAEQPSHLENGIHLIVVQSADGSLVVGDSHHYDQTPGPFADQAVDDLILDEFRAATGLEAPPVLERWTGVYASAAEDMFRATPEPDVRLVMVTSGTGASTAFAIGEETIADLFGPSQDVAA